MIKLIAVAFALVAATSAHAMSPAPLHQPNGMITQVREGCGVGRVRINGICVARTTRRHVRREARREPAEQPAGVRDGLEALAFSTTETPPRNNLPEKCETGQSNNKVGRSPRSPLRAKLYLPPGAYQLTYT